MVNKRKKAQNSVKSKKKAKTSTRSRSTASAKSKPKNNRSSEVILGGWKDDDEDSNSSSDLSETWSELGAQLFSSKSKDQQNDQNKKTNILQNSIPTPTPPVEPSKSPIGSFDDNYDDDNRMDDFSNSDDDDDQHFIPSVPAPAALKRPLKIEKIDLNPVVKIEQFVNAEYGSSNVEDYMIITPNADDNDDDNEDLDLDSDPEFNPTDIDYDHTKAKKSFRRRRKLSRIGKHQFPRQRKYRKAQREQQPQKPKQQPELIPSPFNYSDFEFHCDICNFSYENESYLREHYQKHLEDLRCIGVSLGCREFYQNIEDLKEHVDSCQLASQFKCSALKNINEKPLLCLYISCERSFTQTYAVLRHMKIFQFHFDKNQVINGQIPNPKFPCGICYELFTTYQSLKNHIESKHPESQESALPLVYLNSEFPFICSICDLKYQTQDFLNQHYQYHLDGLRCTGYNLDCPKICESTEELKEHLETCIFAIQLKKSVLINVLEKPYHCLLPECEKIFSSPKLVLRHVKEYHGQRERFANNQINHHDETETEKRFKCKFKDCSRSFKIKYSLLKHQDSHGSRSQEDVIVQNIICHICGAGFAKESRLTDHIRLKHKEKKHICTIDNCNKAFATFPLFKRHIKIHEKLQTLPSNNTCSLCGAYFATKLGLFTHLQRGHKENGYQDKEKSFICETCGNSYIHEMALNRHTRLHSIQLAARKEVYERKLRSQNPQKSDEEIAEILLQWNDDERPLVTSSETSEEKLVRRRLEMIDKITRNGLQKSRESVEDCMTRIQNENKERLRLKREMETEEEMLARRSRYKISFQAWRDKNVDKVRKYYSNYQKDRLKTHPDAYEKQKGYQRDRWARLSAEKKAKRLDQMKNQSGKKKSRNEDDDQMDFF